MSGCSAACQVVKTPPSQMPSRLTVSDRMLLRDDHTHSVEVSVDVIIEGEPSIRARRIAPIDDVEIDPKIQEIADKRAILLQIGHGVTTNQAVDDQHRRLTFFSASGR